MLRSFFESCLSILWRWRPSDIDVHRAPGRMGPGAHVITDALDVIVSGQKLSAVHVSVCCLQMVYFDATVPQQATQGENRCIHSSKICDEGQPILLGRFSLW